MHKCKCTLAKNSNFKGQFTQKWKQTIDGSHWLQWRKKWLPDGYQHSSKYMCWTEERNNLRVSKCWYYFNVWVNYPFKPVKSAWSLTLKSDWLIAMFHQHRCSSWRNVSLGWYQAPSPLFFGGCVLLDSHGRSSSQERNATAANSRLLLRKSESDADAPKIYSYAFKLSNFRFSSLCKLRHPRAIIDPWRVTEMWFVSKNRWYMYVEQAKMCEFCWAKHFLQWLPQWTLSLCMKWWRADVKCIMHLQDNSCTHGVLLNEEAARKDSECLMNQTCVVGYL